MSMHSRRDDLKIRLCQPSLRDPRQAGAGLFVHSDPPQDYVQGLLFLYFLEPRGMIYRVSVLGFALYQGTTSVVPL